MENKLTVKNLRISFRTTNGKVQAVRGINFELGAGETLAIVGESGSGKSVTSKAILGILAGNSIIEGGEIIYDGQDLLKISEDDFHRIRGDKIAMIFQDPMSSLNPIVKIGKQLTEAMILKGKVRQKESRANFNGYLENLRKKMIAAIAPDDAKRAEEITQKCKNFDKFEYKHLELEGAYNLAYESAGEAVSEIESMVFEISKNALRDGVYRVNRVITLSKRSVSTYVVWARKDELLSLTDALKKKISAVRKNNCEGVIEILNAIKEILAEAVAFTQPNFFSMGYYLTFSGEALPEMPTDELNAFLRQYLDEHFMLDFIADAKQGIIYSAADSYEKKQIVLDALAKYRPVLGETELERKTCDAALKDLDEKIKASIDVLDITKDSIAYTFIMAMKTDVDKYFDAIVKNKKEKKRFEKQSAKYAKLEAKGKTPDWKVVPASYLDLEAIRADLLSHIDRMAAHYEQLIAARNERDYDAETVAVIDYLKANASGVVKKVTKDVAKERAIKLMEEVGIPEPRKRYNQYPFEFSGGMRQRIVIGIALAADPDILICDEPTTALDVTIQSQILELINKLKKERNLSIIFITHDLGVVANMADRIAVMYAGKIVEYGTSEDIFYRSAHPYTWALLSSMPDLDTNERLESIPGTPPNMIYPPVGDAFAERNKYALQIDFEQQPPMFKVTDTHYAATWLLHPDAPKVEMPKIIRDRIDRMMAKGGADNGQ